MKVRTRTITVSLIASDADMLESLAAAQNAHLSNVASRCIRRGVTAELATGPAALRERYTAALRQVRTAADSSRIIPSEHPNPIGEGDIARVPLWRIVQRAAAEGGSRDDA